MTGRRRLLLLLVTLLGCRPPSIVPSPPSPSTLPDFALSVRVLPADRRLEVTGRVRLPAAGSKRAELRYGMSERMGELRVEVVAPAISAGPAHVERAAEPRKERVAGEVSDVHWVLRPRAPIPAGEPVVVTFSYEGGGETGFLYYVGPEVAFASGWGDSWYPNFEGTSGKAVGDFTVTVPDGWVVATGRHDARHFTFTAGPYTRVHKDGAVPLTAYLLTPRTQSDAWLEGVESMLRVLSDEFGPYPFDELAVAEVPRDLAKQAGFNAFSPAGMVVLNSRAFDAPTEHLREWLGHELGHQWFPHSVTWDPPGFPYLEESLAEYGGLRIVEELAGAEAARRTRTSGFEYDPIYSAAAYFKQVAGGADRPLATMGTGIDQRNLAYNKGSLVFDMLSREVGRATFQRALHQITGGRRFQTITWTDFVRTVNAAAGRNLDWFFDQWLTRAGAPEFALTWTQAGGSVRVTITQPEPSYRAHLKIEVRGDGDERAARLVDVRGERTVIDVGTAFVARTVVLDPDDEILKYEQRPMPSH